MVKKITLMDLYLIETWRSNGVFDVEIIRQVQARNIERFNFTGLYGLDEAGILKEVLKNGYEIKFLNYTG